MTSKFSIDNRDLLKRISSGEAVVGIDFGNLIVRELAAFRLAAMDSEPFAYIIQDKYERERGVEGHLSRSHVSKYVSQDDINEHEITCTPLYRHAQPAPAAEYETKDEWRRLALQFDGHRMQAICFLKQILKELPASEFSSAREFLKSGPLPGEEVLRNRIAEIAALSQPAPVVPDDVLDALQKVARIRLDLNDFDGDRRGIADCLCDAEEALIEVVNRRAAMLNQAQEPTTDNNAQQFEALATSAQPEIIGYEHRLICGELRRVPKFAGQDIHQASVQREPIAVVKHYTGNTYPTLKFAQDEWSVCGDREDVQELADAINALATSAGSGKP